MSKRIQVLGMDIDNHAVRETMLLAEEYVNTDGINLMGVISSELLMQAADFPQIRQVFDMMELRVIGDIAILEVQEDIYEQQVEEIQRRELEEVFLNYLIRKRKTVFWISDSPSDEEALQDYVREHYPRLDIAGSYFGMMDEENLETIVNEINSVAPDVLMIQTGDWRRLGLLMEKKNQLNARLGVCMDYKLKTRYWSPDRTSKLKSMIDQTMFKRRAIRHEMNKE